MQTCHRNCEISKQEKISVLQDFKQQLAKLQNEEQVIGEYLQSLDCHEYHCANEIPLSLDGKKHLLHILEDKSNTAFHGTSL